MDDFTTFSFTEILTNVTPCKRLIWRDGQIESVPPKVPTAGWFVRRETTLPEFAKWLKEDRCLMLGVTDRDRVGICTKQFPKPDCIPRSKENFRWPEGLRLVLLDIDDLCGLDPDRDNVIRFVRKIVGDVDLVVTPSSSSDLFWKGEPVGGKPKWHIGVTPFQWTVPHLGSDPRPCAGNAAARS